MDFSVYYKRTAVIDLTITADGTPVNLSGKVLKFSVKNDYKDADPIIVKDTTDGITIINAENGEARITLQTTDTDQLSNREYIAVYDVHLIDGTADYQILDGRLIVHPTIGV